MNNAAIALLKELKFRPEWQQIIDEIQRNHRERYSPKAGDEEAKKNEWIYQSGRSDENDRVINLLTLNGVDNE